MRCRELHCAILGDGGFHGSILSMITAAEIENLASLARIELSSGEKENLKKDMGAILDYVSQIKKVSAEVKGEQNMSPAAPVNVMREDENPHESGIYTEKLLSSAPQREWDYILVKKIL